MGKRTIVTKGKRTIVTMGGRPVATKSDFAKLFITDKDPSVGWRPW
ncbi:MAG: hypothetical protein OXU73_00590 [Candidatus Campbellbacteria bacterium]|nr:hypothetical protein [Candidatus Campbellbacteria bacterium]